MNVKIITLHSIYNPGSVFQAFGLQEFLKKNNCDVQIIDYRPSYSTIGKNKIKGLLRKILYYKNEKKVKEKYEEFIEQKMLLTEKRYRSYRNLKANVPMADIYISGSDQLWNMDYDCGCDEAYYLSFVKEGVKISYATSIGKKCVPENELCAITTKIKSFKLLSVREMSTSKLLSNELHREVHWVCDPVFLLPTEVYEKMTKKLEMEKYVIVYLSAESEVLNKVVRDIKDKTNYKVILIGGNRTRCECDKHVKDLGPYEFLSYLRYAEIVISSSFHATAFSHIFHKKFVAILPKTNGERIESLLELSGLSNRIIREKEDIPILYEDIDYDLVEKKLASFIEKSKEILIRSLR